MLVKAPVDDFAAFPDASVVCAERVMLMHEKNAALTNPTVIVEVLSSSTEDYDRGEKFERYKTRRSSNTSSCRKTRRASRCSPGASAGSAARPRTARAWC